MKRSELFVTSKLWNTEHNPKHVRPALLRTLQDLKLEYLDLYLIHWPVAFEKTPDGNPCTLRAHARAHTHTHSAAARSYARFVSADPKNERGGALLADIPLLDTWQAMEQLVRDGLVRAIGVANFSAAELRPLLAKARIAPAANQFECHPYLPQRALREFCHEENIHTIAYASLGATNRHSPPVDVPLLAHPTVVQGASRLGITPAQLLLKWSVQQGNLVIPKSVTPARIEENFRLPSAALPAPLMQQLDELGKRPLRLLNPITFRAKDGERFFPPDA